MQIRSFQSSTCFEQTRAHHQEVSCINTASGIVTLRPVSKYVYFNPLRVSSMLMDYVTSTRHNASATTQNKLTTP